MLQFPFASLFLSHFFFLLFFQSFQTTRCYEYLTLKTKEAMEAVVFILSETDSTLCDGQGGKLKPGESVVEVKVRSRTSPWCIPLLPTPRRRKPSIIQPHQNHNPNSVLNVKEIDMK